MPGAIRVRLLRTESNVPEPGPYIGEERLRADVAGLLGFQGPEERCDSLQVPAYKISPLILGFGGTTRRGGSTFSLWATHYLILYTVNP